MWEVDELRLGIVVFLTSAHKHRDSYAQTRRRDLACTRAPSSIMSILAMSGYRVRNVTILEGEQRRIGFLTKCGGINRGDTPRVPKAPRGVPEVDPDTRGQENPISLSTDKSIVNILPVWSIIPRGGHSYTKTPHGMFCLYG